MNGELELGATTSDATGELTVGRRDAAPAFHSDLHKRLTAAMSAAKAQTVGDLDEETFDRVLAEAAATARISIDEAWSLLARERETSSTAHSHR